MSETVRIAAIDIGTVTTRLLIADVACDSISEVVRSTDITHLGEGLTESGALAPAAMERVADVAGGYLRTCRERGVAAVRAIATSAARDAANGEEFARILAGRGLELEIVDGSKEAELAFRGATWDLRGAGLLVVDCGGGSTELVYGDAEVAPGASGPSSRIALARSVDVGSRRMTERFFRTDPPAPDELETARAWAAEEMRPYFDRLDRRPARVIGLAGTATSLAAIRLGLEPYDPGLVHGYELAGSDLSDVLEELAGMTLEERRLVRGLHPERAGVIVAGALILETVLALAGNDRMTVSEHDLLYGILVDACPDLRERDR